MQPANRKTSIPFKCRLAVHLIAGFLVVQPVLAQDQKDELNDDDVSQGDLARVQESFRKADRNRDGAVDWAEIQLADRQNRLSDMGLREERVLSQFDDNRDGVLQENEYVVFVSHVADQMIDGAAEAGSALTGPANELAAETVDEPLVPLEAAGELPGAISEPAIQIAGAEGGFRTLAVEVVQGAEVVNLKGDEIGEVADVVRETDGNDVGLVIGLGGFFGLGVTEIFVPIEAFYIVGQQLVWETLLSEETVKEREGFRYDDERYTSLIEGEAGPTLGTARRDLDPEY